MLCPIKVSPQTGVQIAHLLTTYGVSLDAFMRANLQFLAVVMPTVAGIADQAGTSSKRDFTLDLVTAVLPCLRAQSEFRRICAHVDDSIIRLRAQRLEVEAMRQQRGEATSGTPRPRRIHRLVNPRTVVPESQQYLTTSELQLLSMVGKRRGHPLLYVPGPVMTNEPRYAGALDLNLPGQNFPGLRGMEILRYDIERWLTLLQYYGFVPLDVTIAVSMKSEDGAALRSGFTSLLSQIAQVVCFVFSANQGLAQVSYREDLVSIHERGTRLAAAWEAALLEAEVTIHQLNGHSEVMVRSLLIMASGAAPGEDIYGDRHAVPGIKMRAATSEMVPEAAEIACLPPVADELF